MSKTEVEKISRRRASITQSLRGEFRRFDKYFQKLGYEVATSTKNPKPKFDAILISTRGFKFDRDEANAR